MSLFRTLRIPLRAALTAPRVPVSGQVVQLTSTTSSPQTVDEDLELLPSDVNPYEKEKPVCLLCKYKIPVDYKNVRFLSQFVSPFTGRVYGRHITGLCEHQQTIVEKSIFQSRRMGLMPEHRKHVEYIRDPQLFDVNRPIRPHRF